MIFVTVGTHEQPFNRLVEAVDQWAASSDEDVLIQTGYSTITPKHCRFKDFLPREEMVENIKNARIVITHGGPCCYTEVQTFGKIPIVVPRNHKFGEQFDDHQVEICREYKSRYNHIILIEDIATLSDSIDGYDAIVKDMGQTSGLSHNMEFCKELSRTVDRLFGEEVRFFDGSRTAKTT